MAIRKGQEISSNSGKIPISLSSAATTTPAPATTTSTTAVPSSTAASATDSSERFDKLMLLRGGDSEPFDASDSEFAGSSDSSAMENGSDSEDEAQQQQAEQDKPAEVVDLEQTVSLMEPLDETELEDGSVRVAGSSSPPPMVTSLK